MTVRAGMELDPATVRAKYDQSADLPDGDAFLAVIRTLDFMDRDQATAWIGNGTGLSPGDSEALLDRLLHAFATFNVEMDGLKARMACARDRVLATDDIYAVFEAIDDARTALAAQHLARVKAEAGSGTAARLQQWLEANKLQDTWGQVCPFLIFAPSARNC